MEWKLYFAQGAELLFLGFGSYYDIRDREIPDWFLLLFACFGVMGNIVWKYQKLQEIFLGICIGAAFLLIGWISREAIGYGDGIGFMILGLFGGYRELVSVLLPAFLFGGIYGFCKILRGGRPKKDPIPFYPFLFLSLLGVIVL